MKLRARWTGTLPQVGQYLASSTRPRYAYRILGVCKTGDVFDRALARAQARLVIDVERIAYADVPHGARLHDWQWDKRIKLPRTRHGKPGYV